MKIENKALLIILIVIVSLGVSIFFGCSIPGWVDVFGNGFDTMSLEYDEKIKLPILQQIINLDDFFTETPVANYNSSIPGFSQWPAPVDATLDYDQLGIVSQVETTVDFSPVDGTPDFVIEGFRSTNASLALTAWLTNNLNATVDINLEDITLGNLKVEGVNYTFDSGTKVGNTLIYNSTNFLDPGQDYYLSLKGSPYDPSNDGGRLDVEQFLISFKSDTTPDHTANPPYTFHVSLDFDFGSNYEVVGTVINDAVVYHEIQPLSNLFSTFQALDDFKFDFIFGNDLPLDLSLDIVFTADNTPDPNTKSVKILSGELSPNAQNGYLISVGPIETGITFGFNGDVISYGDLSMDATFKLSSTGQTIKLTTGGTIEIDLNIRGTATINPL